MIDLKLPQKLYMDAACCSEQILEAGPQKTAAIWPLTSHLTNNPSKICWWSKDELISGALLWTLTHGHTSVG